MNVTKHARLRLSQSFYRTTALLFSLFFAIFSFFGGYTYYNSHKALRNEFMSYGEQQIYALASAVDSSMKDIRMIMGGLYSNSYVRSFVYAKESSPYVSTITNLIMEQLHILTSSSAQIQSIHIWSPVSQKIISNTKGISGIYGTESFTDLEWMNQLENASSLPYLIYARENAQINGSMITLLKTYNTPSGYGAVVVNLHTSIIPPLPSYEGSPTSKICIVSDNNTVLYFPGQTHYPESIDIIPVLEYFDITESEKQLFINDGGKTYIYNQQHSADYPWSYVMISEISDYTSRLTGSRNFVFSLIFFSLMLGIIMIFIIVFRATKPIHAILHLLDAPEDFLSYDIQNLPGEENQRMIRDILSYIQASTTLSDELEKQMIRLKDARMLALQTQINPHFLMNTLSTIYSVAADSLGYEHKATKMTFSLSKLLRYALDTSNNAVLDVEVKHAMLFANLINNRYQDSIHFEFNIHSDVEDIIVPKLIIQPLIENAVFHGLSMNQGASHSLSWEKRISVKAVAEKSKCILTVTDNGIGISHDKLAALIKTVSDYEHTPSASIGLHNVMLRMHLMYGDAFSFRIESTACSDASTDNQETSVVLQFPLDIKSGAPDGSGSK